MADYTCHKSKNYTFPWKALTADGGDATVDGTPTIHGDNDAIATAAIVGGNVNITTVGGLGIVTFTVEGDKDLSPDINEPISKAFTFEVVSDTADHLDFGAGSEVDK